MVFAQMGGDPVNIGAHLISKLDNLFQTVQEKTWEGFIGITQDIDEFIAQNIAGREDKIAAFVVKPGVNAVIDFLNGKFGGPGAPGIQNPPQLNKIFEIPLFSGGRLEVYLGIGEPTNLFDALSDVGKDALRELWKGSLDFDKDLWKQFSRYNTYLFGIEVGLRLRF